LPVIILVMRDNPHISKYLQYNHIVVPTPISLELLRIAIFSI
jgi:hypothetical protein